MSNLAESFALQNGVVLDTPTIQELFYPLGIPMDKAILINNFSGDIQVSNGQHFAVTPARIYDYFDEVVDMLRPVLEPKGYKFFQIGAAGNPMRHVESLVGKISPLQTVYLVRRAALFLDNDSIWSHIRGTAKKPLIQIFGPTSPNEFAPYWRDNDKTVLFEPHRNGKKASYQAVENPKTINLIPPESIVNAALRLLGISDQIEDRTIFIGSEYDIARSSYEIVPNIVVKADINIGTPVIRMDYEFNEEGMAKNLQMRSCSISMDKEIDIRLLVALKKNINSIRAEVDHLSPEWISAAKKTGIPFMWVSKEKDEKKLSEMRLKLFDTVLFDKMEEYNFQLLTKGVENYLNSQLDIKANLPKIFFKTNRFLLSGGRQYLSKAHWKVDCSSPWGINEGSIIDNEEFWAEGLNHWYFLTV